jgi:hypothetical protein
MKAYVGTMYRIIIEKKCGCRATQEFKDAVMKEPDGEPTYKACDKHKKGQAGEIIQELMFEVLESKAEEHRSKASIEIAEQNAVRRGAAAATPVGEGAVAETRTPVRIAGTSPKPAPTAAPSGSVPNQTRPLVKVREANLSGGSKSGLRRAAPATRQSVVAKIAADRPVEAGDLQIDPVSEDPRVTAILVDDPTGGLLGAHDDESEA